MKGEMTQGHFDKIHFFKEPTRTNKLKKFAPVTEDASLRQFAKL